MTKNQHKKLGLFLIIVLGFFLNSLLLTFNTFQSSDYQNYESKEFITPKFAAALKYSDIIQNTTSIYRLFESINFTIDTSNDFPDADHITMEIQFSNNSVRNYNMTLVDTDEFYYEYIPEYDAPLEFQNVSFLIYNDTHTLLNDHATYTNFTIQSNCYAWFNSSEYYIGDTIYADLIVNNFTSNSIDYEFQWDLTIVDSMNETIQKNLIDLNSNSISFTLPVDNETFQDVNKIYYLKVNMTDIINGKIVAAYFPFNIKNSDPIISSEIDLSPDEYFRTDDCFVSVNATDIETAAENLTITVTIQDSQGVTIIEKDLSYDGDNLFSTSFVIPSNRPAGRYKIDLTAKDEDNGIDSKTTFLTVKNNPPEIHSYEINGLSMTQGISIFYGRNLVFSFNVSDTEGVSYVKIALFNENNEWFNITRDYKGTNTEITIRTVDLIGGIWYVYVYVIDTDGTVISLIDDYDMAPQGIRIIPDVLSGYISWIVFFVGLIIGVLAGIGVIYKYFKSKFGQSQAVSPKKRETTSKKQVPKKKVKPKIVEEELKEEESKESIPEKEELKEGAPKRKIKRKL